MSSRRVGIGIVVLAMSAMGVGPASTARAEHAALSITEPAVDEDVPTGGMVMRGTAQGTGPQVRVFVMTYSPTGSYYTVLGEPAEFDPSTGRWQFAVRPEVISPGPRALFWAHAVDEQGNSLWQWRESRIRDGVQDRTPPEVAITQPSVSIPAAGGTFEGTVQDDQRIERLRIFVMSETPNGSSFVVQDAAAEHDVPARTWRFAVTPEHLAGARRAGLWVQAVDAAGNASAWQLREVPVVSEPTPGPGPIGPSVVEVRGTRLLVAKRQADGRLLPARPWKMLGVNYSSVPQGEQILTREDARRFLREAPYAGDFELIQRLGANTLRFYADAGSSQAAVQVLDAAYANGLMVLVTLDVGMPDLEAVVGAYRNHPALLGWLIGNEWNLNLFYQFATIEAAAAALEQTAQQVRALDSNHPVGSVLGFGAEHINMGPRIATSRVNVPLTQMTFTQLLQQTPSVQWWGFNVYRVTSLEPLMLEWQSLRQASGFSGAFFVAEFGTDSWNAGTQGPDEAQQARADRSLWESLRRNLSALDERGQAVGGLVFAWVDEFWKAGDPSRQEPNGFALRFPIIRPGTQETIAVFEGHPDGFSNEEYYGLVTIDRQPKAAFPSVQQAYALGQAESAAIDLRVTSAGDPGGYVRFDRQGTPMLVRFGTVEDEGQGITVAVLDRATGSLRVARNFDTVTDPQGSCQALAGFTESVTPGDVVLAAVGGSAVDGRDPQGFGSSTMAACGSALERLGSRMAAELRSSEPWALMSVAGQPASLLAEQRGAAGGRATAAASVALDADRDGVDDAVDPDDDNDGISDVAEQAGETDPLDPNDPNG